MESSLAPSTFKGPSPTVSHEEEEDEMKSMEMNDILFGNGFSQLNKSYLKRHGWWNKPGIMKDNEDACFPDFKNSGITISTAAEIDNVISDVIKILRSSTLTTKSSIEDEIKSISKEKFLATTLIDSTIPTESNSSDTTLEDKDYADSVADTIMYHRDSVNECGESKLDDDDRKLLKFLNEVMQNSEENIANQEKAIADMEEENKTLCKNIEILTKLKQRKMNQTSV